MVTFSSFFLNQTFDLTLSVRIIIVLQAYNRLLLRKILLNRIN